MSAHSHLADVGEGPLAPADLDAQELIESARRARSADRDLAEALGQPPADGPDLTRPYLQSLVGAPALPAALERSLVAAAKSGDASAKAQLVEAFLPQISRVARIYRHTPRIERLELLQEGVVGLLRALERYDQQTGVPFWGYAAWWVRQSMQQLVAELTRPLILSDRTLRQLARLRDAQRAALAASGGQTPTIGELVERSGLSVAQVQALLAIDQPSRSLDEALLDEEGEVAPLGELIADPSAEEDYERVLDAIEKQELLALLSGLSEREREVIRARYGLDGKEHSLAQIAAKLGVSAERVRQLEQRALAKLRAAARLTN